MEQENEIKLIKWKIGDAIIIDDVTKRRTQIQEKYTYIEIIAEVLGKMAMIAMSAESEGIMKIEGDAISGFEDNIRFYVKRFRLEYKKLYNLINVTLNKVKIEDIIFKNNDFLNKLNIEFESNTTDETHIISRYEEQNGDLKKIVEVYKLINKLIENFYTSDNRLKINFLFYGCNEDVEKMMMKTKEAAIARLYDISIEIKEAVAIKVNEWGIR